MSNQLALLDLPGCTLTKRTLEIPPSLDKEQIPLIGSKLLAVRGCMKWAIGALLWEMVARTPKQKDNDDYTWANHFADAHDIDPKERRELIALHLFYPPASRTLDLSYQHYKEAMLGVPSDAPNQLKKALGYLAQAQDNDWTHTELRRHIRQSQATERPDSNQSGFKGYGVIFDFRRYIQHEAARPITPDRAALILADIGEDTLDFIDKLRAIAATIIDPSPGKESFLQV